MTCVTTTVIGSIGVELRVESRGHLKVWVSLVSAIAIGVTVIVGDCLAM